MTSTIEAANKAMLDGTASRIIQASLEKLRPEAAHFSADDEARRSCFSSTLKVT